MARPRSSKSTADAAYREVGQAIESVQQELEQLRNEGIERAQVAARGAALIGGAGALGLVSVGALGSLPLMALRRVLPAWMLALLVAGGSAAGAAVLGRAGFGRLAAISPEALEGARKGGRRERGRFGALTPFRGRRAQRDTPFARYTLLSPNGITRTTEVKWRLEPGVRRNARLRRPRPPCRSGLPQPG